MDGVNRRLGEPREDRRSLGRPLGDEITRSRLIDVLAERWAVRVVTVEAAGGFGKSIALAQAIRDNDEDPSGIDVYIRCRPTMRTVTDVADAVLDQIGARTSSGEASLSARIASAVESHSPADVCICLDDVHVVGELDGVAEFLGSLLDDLPFHGHLVLSGRSLPALRTARLRAADQIVEVTADDLAFDGDELEAVAAIHDVDASKFESAGGWPALTRLSITAERDAPAAFLIEEIISTMSTVERAAMAVAVIAGAATPDLLGECAVDVNVSELLRSVPLLTDYGDGSFGAHDLWHEMVDHLASSEQQRAIAAHVLAHLAGSGRHRDAVDAALRHELWAAALDHLMAVFVDLDVAVDLAAVDRWVGCLPDHLADEPAFQFVRGIRDRMAGDIAGSSDLIRQAATGFEARGDLDAETTAVLELGLRSWLLDDSELWADMWDRSVRIVRDGGVRMATTSATGRVVTAERAGDFARALREYESAGVASDIALGHAATLAMLIGEPAKSIAYLERQMVDFPKPSVEGLLSAAHWQSGDPSVVIASGEYTSHRLDNSRDVLLGVFIEAMVRANFGLEPDAERVEKLAWSRSREQTFVALVRAARALIDGDEATAAADFEERLAEIGFREPLLRGELRRYLPYSYVLSSTARAWLDTGEGFGPLHFELRSLARTLVAARERPLMSIGELPANESILTWLPLPWSVELAARLSDAGDRRGRTLIDYLADVAGAAVHHELRRAVVRWPELAGAVERILAAVPAPPPEVTTVRLCGPAVEVAAGDGDPELLMRKRVGQTLALLALGDGWTRQGIQSALWPDLDSQRARGNLRSTLRHVRVTLEPARSSGEASFHLRQRGDRVWLQRSELLDIDVWSISRDLTLAEQYVEAGDLDEATALRAAAVGQWAATALAAVRDLDAAAAAVVELERRVTSAGCSAAERLLSQGRFAEGSELARRVLSWDPFSERAHDVSIGASLASGDLDQAERAIENCLERLEELGVQPSSGTEMLVRRFERRSGRGRAGRSA